jgi:protein-S-isoprenylcysteine O-methyltransferase Ste14
MIAVKILVIVLLYATFSLVHTYLAKIEFKERVAKRYPKFLPYYRFSYNLYAVLHFSLIYKLSPDIDIRLYDLPKPFDLIMLAVQYISLAGAIWVFYRIGFKEFLGVSQIERDIFEEYDRAELDEQTELITNGPFSICRHPLYFFASLWLLARPEMMVDYFISVSCIVAYFIIGAAYEEKKMLARYGKQYQDYCEGKARFIPNIW